MAAALSSTGSAHELMQLSHSGQVVLIISSLVTEEVERNLDRKAPNKSPRLRQLLDDIAFEQVEPSATAIAREAEHVVPKDAAIVAAAVAANVDFLVTYDERHLLAEADSIQSRHGIVVCTPAVMIVSRGGSV